MQKPRNPKSILFSSLGLCLVLFAALEAAAAMEDPLESLKRKLVSDGFSSRRVSSLFDPPPPLQYSIVSQSMRIREGKRSYAHFLTPSAIARARRFHATHRTILRTAERTYGVDASVITAILLVETNFGSYTGHTPTLGVFTTFALMDQEQSRDRVWALMSPKDRERWGREAFDAKLCKRADWAYQELCALIRWTDSQGLRPESFKGSYMGAVGWAQFLPTSIVKWGADGDKDGRVNLFEAEDAVFSVANYLREHGWREAKSEADKEAVIYTYNHSSPYVRAVLDIADRVRD